MEKSNWCITPEEGGKMLLPQLHQKSVWEDEECFPYSWIDTGAEDCNKLDRKALIERISELLNVVKNLEHVIDLKDVQITECNSMLDHLIQLNAELMRKFSDQRVKEESRNERAESVNSEQDGSERYRDGAITSESQKLCREIISELFSSVGVEPGVEYSSGPETDRRNIAIQTELDMMSDWESLMSYRDQPDKSFPVVLTPAASPRLPLLQTRSNVEINLFAETMATEILNVASKSESAIDGAVRAPERAVGFKTTSWRPLTGISEYLSNTLSYETTTWSSNHDDNDESIIADEVMPEFSLIDSQVEESEQGSEGCEQRLEESEQGSEGREQRLEESEQGSEGREQRLEESEQGVERPHTSVGSNKRDVDILIVGSEVYKSSESSSDDDTLGIIDDDDGDDDDNLFESDTDENNNSDDLNADDVAVVTAIEGVEKLDLDSIKDENMENENQSETRRKSDRKCVETDDESPRRPIDLQCSGRQMELQSKPVLLRKTSAKLLEKRPTKSNNSVLSPRKTMTTTSQGSSSGASPGRQLRDHSHCSRSACPNSKDIVHLSLRDVPPAKLPFRGNAAAVPSVRKSLDGFNSSPRMMATFPPPAAATQHPAKNLPSLPSAKYPTIDMSDRVGFTFSADKKKKPSGL
ncbi:uncharacterized protein LOC141913404 [Tubulanus polymorphus]|uniref:uncharacterized protein LOC141913404 n=1 Tax=Tubulanus polymorphus TaxID=672921 RepID=UPI003DA5A8C1